METKTTETQVQTNGAAQTQSNGGPVDRMEQATYRMAEDISGLRAEFKRQNGLKATGIKVGIGVAVVTVGALAGTLAANAIANRGKAKLPAAK